MSLIMQKRLARENSIAMVEGETKQVEALALHAAAELKDDPALMFQLGALLQSYTLEDMYKALHHAVGQIR